MTIASHHHRGTNAGEGRPWIVVVAATGWVVVTTVAVLLATDVWSVDRMVGGEQSGGGELGPAQRSPTRTTPPAPRVDHEGLAYTGSPLALVPRQAAAHDR